MIKMEKNNLQKYKEDALKYGVIKEKGKIIKNVGLFIKVLYGGEELNSERLRIKNYLEEQEGGKTISRKVINERVREQIDDFYFYAPQCVIPDMISEIKKYKETVSPEFLEIVKDDLNSLEKHCVRCLKFKKFD